MTAAPIPSAATVLRWLARWPAATLFALCLLALLPGFFSLPPLDRDESRFAQASKQMVETGNLIDIRFSEGARYNKPVGIYWLQAASEKVFGGGEHNHIWTYRLPSLLGGFLALLFAYWCARAFAPAETALLSAALLGSTLLMTAEANIATTDAVLLATILAAQAVFMRVYLAARDKAAKPPSPGIVLAGWVAIGIGILIKGPVVVAVLAVTVIAISIWDREWKWLKATKPQFGIPLAAAIVLPWAIAIGIESHGAFYQQSLGHDFGNKILGGQESHGALPGYFLLLASLTLWPATLLALPGAISGLTYRRYPASRYLFAWAAATWIMFELVPTKLPHYILPAYPALAMLGAMWAMRPSLVDEPRRDRIPRLIACAQFALGALVLAAAPFVATRKFGAPVSPALLAGVAIFAAIALFASVSIARRKVVTASLAAIAAAIVIYPVLTVGVAPSLTPIWTSPRAAALIAQARKPGDPPVILAGYVEPSIVFLLGTDTRLATGRGAADLAAGQGGLALVEDHEQKNFLDRLSARNVASAVVDRLAGYDYSNGHAVHLTLYRTMPSLQITTPSPE